jgi:hypothetical protein
LRVSHRALDPSRSRPSQPYHSHDRLEKISADEIVPVEIEILSSSTWFERASRLQVTILGRDAARYPAFRHRHLVNRGRHVIHCGGRFDSYLFMPLIRGAIRRCKWLILETPLPRRLPHSPKVAGSNPAQDTNNIKWLESISHRHSRRIVP